jgi:hypothetical protein
VLPGHHGIQDGPHALNLRISARLSCRDSLFAVQAGVNSIPFNLFNSRCYLKCVIWRELCNLCICVPPTCTANSQWCSVATCPACLPLLPASTPPARDRAGSAAHRRPLRRFRTEGFCFVLLVAGPCFSPGCPRWSSRFRACFGF